MKFFIADTHFNHKNIIKYCNRPFGSVEEMNRALIKNWNNVVGPNDTVYHLGDFGFGDIERIRCLLNGKIVLIIGSHDKAAKRLPHLWAEPLTPLLEITVYKQHIVLCHYAMRVWPRSHYNSWHLYGHSHGWLPGVGKAFDVGVDRCNFRPLSFCEIKGIMDQLSDNFNRVK